MIQTTVAAPGSVSVTPSPAAPQPLSAAAAASIAAYVAAGERMRIIAQWLGLACVGLLVIIAVAWAMGLLPLAVALF